MGRTFGEKAMGAAPGVLGGDDPSPSYRISTNTYLWKAAPGEGCSPMSGFKPARGLIPGHGGSAQLCDQVFIRVFEPLRD